ncbi:hypothetical protein POPTR_003G082900v4 [Populus trichocarpa]|jgi:hypothetical protein|uniref:Uncharacterized protein n=1 Tax=Populus trichocarpa TaxID=3694 RepID=A0ACC0T8G4_POPTR|nr:hypothetical protein POPTR_003G082900v4 [Populus trichocarpa]
MEENDPFAAITKLCQVSSSQEQHLNHCPFALEPQTSGELLSLDAEIPVASTAITMVSPPQTPQDNHKDGLQNDDVFTTPPEEPFLSSSKNQHEQQQQEEEEEVAFDHGKEDRRLERAVTDENIAVDDGDCEESSREKDLGFTVEGELTERIEIEGDSGGGEDNSQDKEVIHCNYMKGMVLKRVLASSNNVLGESSSKRSKLNDKNLGMVTPEPSLRAEIGNSLKRLVKSLDKFKWTPSASVGAEPVKYDERLVKTVDVTMTESKRSKPLDKNSVLGIPSSSLVSDMERIREDLGDYVEKLGSEGGNDSNHGLKSPQNEQVGEMVIEVSNSDRECSGESSAKRKLQFSTEVIESEFEETDAALRFVDGVEEREANTREEHSARKSIDDLDKFRYVGPANVYGKDDVTEKRVLPASVQGRKENAGAGKAEHVTVLSEMTCMDLEITLLDVLKTLAENEHCDPSLEKLSILDAATIGGMTFP